MESQTLNVALEIECWSEKRARLYDDLERLQSAMIADTTIWNQENITRCATLVGNLNYADAKLKHLKGQQTANVFPTFAPPQFKFDFTNPFAANQNSGQKPVWPQTENIFKPANVFGENPSSHSGKKHPFGETTEDTRKSFSFGTSPLSGTQAKTTNNALNDDTARKRTKSSANSSAVQQKLSELESVLHGYSMKVRAFIGSPPTTEAFGQNVYASYSSSIFENVIAELDQVEADGEDRDRRRKLVKEAEELMKELDAMVPPSKVWKPEASFRATDRTGDFKIHPIELD